MVLWQQDIQVYHVWYETDQDILNQELRYISCIRHSIKT